MRSLLILVLVLLICLSSLGAKCTPEEYIDWENKYHLLYLSYNETVNQRNIARAEVKKLEQAILDIQTSHASTVLSYKHLKEEYRSNYGLALRYIDMAEYILFNMEIDFVYAGERIIPDEW